MRDAEDNAAGSVTLMSRSNTSGTFTIFTATHEMDFARHAADQVCFLEGGVIRERGSPEQMLTEPREAATQRFLARLLKR